MKEDDLYAKYSHIIPGSIEYVPKGVVVQAGKNQKIVSHGRICVIKCADADTASDCLKTRIINVQDARQTMRCKICVRRERNIRRRKPNYPSKKLN